MSTWELEYFTNTAGTGTGDKRTLAAWGFAALDLEGRNWARGDLVLTVRTGTAFSDNPTFTHGNKIIVWRDGARVWHGWHIAPQRNLTAPAEARTYRFGDCWYLLEQYHPRHLIVQKDHVYTTLTEDLVGGGVYTYEKIAGCTWETPLGDIVWSNWDDQSLITAQGQVRRALYSAIWAGAPIAIGTIAIDMKAPRQDTNGNTCASAVQAAGRFAVNSVGWWDPSGATPVFNCADRSGAEAHNHPLADAVETVAIAPLHDQQAFAVRLRYWAGPGSDYHVDDTAGDDARPEGFGTLIVDIQVSDEVGGYKSKRYDIAAKMFAALGPLSWGGQIDLHEVGSALPWYRPGHALNLTGGRAELATMAAIVQQVTHHVGAETTDTCSITLGAPDHLGVQDWFELASIGGLAGGSGGNGGQEPAGDPEAGTIPELNPTSPATSVPSGSIDRQQRGGTGAMCGWVSYTEPARVFGSRALSGSITRTAYAGLVCGGAATYTSTSTWSGTATKGLILGACSVTATGQVSDVVNGGTPSVTAVDTVSNGNLYADERSETLTATTRRVTSLGLCKEDPGNAASSHPVGYAQETLSSEITDESEIARILAANDWTTGTGPARRNIRTTTPTILYAEMRFRPTIPSGQTVPGFEGGKAWFPYSLTANLERAPIDEAGNVTGAWVPMAPVVAQTTADLDGYIAFPDWTEIIPDPGYATRISPTLDITLAAK